MTSYYSKSLIFINIKAEAHTAITKYSIACNKPLFFILSLSPDEKAFIQLDKLNPAKGITAPDIKAPKEAKNIIIFLFLYKAKILPLFTGINFCFFLIFSFFIALSSLSNSPSTEFSKIKLKNVFF